MLALPLQPETIVTHEHIDDWLSSLSALGRSQNTLRGYGADMTQFLTTHTQTHPTEMQTTIATLEWDLMDWLNSLRRETNPTLRVAPTTLNRKLASSKGFCQHLDCLDNLRRYDKPTIPPGKPHPLPEGIEGVYRMVEVTTDLRQRALVALCGLVACRISEARAVTFKDFTEPTQFEPRQLKIFGKGDKYRDVPVSERAWKYIQPAFMMSFFNEGIPLVPYCDRVARDIVTDLGRKAGISRRVASHDLRATCATAIYRKTKDVLIVQRILGHASVITTQGYLGIMMSEMGMAVEL